MSTPDISNFIPMYIDQTINKAAKTAITAERWNELWNLVIAQGDYNSEAIDLICDDLLLQASTAYVDTLDAQNVKITGDQSIAGIKTFTASPVVPVASADTQAPQKLYVDQGDATNTANLETHKTSADHDGRYYTETEVDALDTAQTNALNTHKSSSDHDGRYYTEAEFSSVVDGSAGGDLVAMTPIPNVTGGTAQAIAEDLKSQIDDIVAGGVSDGTITNAKLATDVKVGSLATLTTTEKSSVTGAVNELDTDLGAIENVLSDSFYADLQAYYGNTKLADDFQVESDWTSGTGTQSVGTNFKIGKQSLRLTENTGGATGSVFTEQAKTIDFTSLTNGETSGDDDYIYVVFNLSDVSKFSLVQVAFSVGVAYDGANRIFYNITSGLATGWNYFKIRKGDFTAVGTATFGNVGHIRVLANTQNTPLNAYIEFQLIQLVKKDPSLSIPNAFQRNGVADKEINSNDWFVGYEFGQLSYKNLSNDQTSQNPNDRGLLGKKRYANFTAFRRAVVNIDQFMSFFGADYDYENWINCRVNANTFEIRKVIGSTVTVLYDETFTAVEGDIVDVKIVKDGNDFSFTFSKNGGEETVFNFTDSTLGAYDYVIEDGVMTTTNTRVLAQSITEITHAHHADIAEVAKGLTEQARAKVRFAGNQSIPNSTPTSVAFNSILWDNRGFFDANNNTILTITENGLYDIKFNGRFAINSVGTRTGSLLLNGATILDADTRNANDDGNNTHIKLDSTYNLQKGDYIEVQVRQTSGGALNLEGVLDYSPALSATKIN